VPELRPWPTAAADRGRGGQRAGAAAAAARPDRAAGVRLRNTRYLERTLAALREVEDVPDPSLAHLSPPGWEHVHLTGDHVWAARAKVAENPPLHNRPAVTPWRGGQATAAASTRQ
jgi:hypothetical protein